MKIKLVQSGVFSKKQEVSVAEQRPPSEPYFNRQGTNQTNDRNNSAGSFDPRPLHSMYRPAPEIAATQAEGDLYSGEGIAECSFRTTIRKLSREKRLSTKRVSMAD